MKSFESGLSMFIKKRSKRPPTDHSYKKEKSNLQNIITTESSSLVEDGHGCSFIEVQNKCFKVRLYSC